VRGGRWGVRGWGCGLVEGGGGGGWLDDWWLGLDFERVVVTVRAAV